MPWGYFILCIVGLIGIFWGWGNDEDMPCSLCAVIAGAIFYTWSLLVILPWSIS